MQISKVYLTLTDTSIGFVSQDKDKLSAIKKRPTHKHYIMALDSLETLKSFARVPNSQKNRVRRSSKTTFILPKGDSYRVIKDEKHLELIERLRWAYTTSANLSDCPYDEEFAKRSADVIIEPLNDNSTSSTIYKISNTQIKRIR